MVEVKDTIKGLITKIYENQKRVMINKRFILEIENNGGNASRLLHENFELEKRISEYKKKLSSLNHLN